MPHPQPTSARTIIFLAYKKREWVQSPINLLLGPGRRGLRFGETNTLKGISQWKCVIAMFVCSAKRVDFSWDPTISIITGAASIYRSATVDSLCLSFGLKKASAWSLVCLYHTEHSTSVGLGHSGLLDFAIKFQCNFGCVSNKIHVWCEHSMGVSEFSASVASYYVILDNM